MARRVGKAASRKARQRNVKRASRAASSPAFGESVAPAGDPTQDVSQVTSPASPAPVRRPASSSTSAGSTLTSSERAEYHYVERDLRNIGILTAAMAAMLLVAWLIFSALGLVG